MHGRQTGHRPALELGIPLLPAFTGFETVPNSTTSLLLSTLDSLVREGKMSDESTTFLRRLDARWKLML